jgi:hypothetical protein
VDSDLRFMALNDLATEINKTSFSVDAATENLLVDQVLALLSDVNAGKSFSLSLLLRAHAPQQRSRIKLSRRMSCLNSPRKA